MDERERNITDAFVAMREFNTRNAADYAAVSDAAANFAILSSVIDNLENYAATQTSGGRGQAVTQKSVLAAAIRRRLKDISRTARALNFDDEGFRRLFRTPDSNSEQNLLAAAREFASEAAKHEIDFLRLAMPTSFVDDLNQDIADFEQAANQKASSQGAGVGATAGIDEEIARGMQVATILDAIMQNVYRNNPVKLAQWTQARHVRRSAQRASPAETKVKQ